jgi:hypothetical protein
VRGEGDRLASVQIRPDPDVYFHSIEATNRGRLCSSGGHTSPKKLYPFSGLRTRCMLILGCNAFDMRILLSAAAVSGDAWVLRRVECGEKLSFQDEYTLVEESVCGMPI